MCHQPVCSGLIAAEVPDRGQACNKTPGGRSSTCKRLRTGSRARGDNLEAGESELNSARYVPADWFRRSRRQRPDPQRPLGKCGSRRETQYRRGSFPLCWTNSDLCLSRTASFDTAGLGWLGFELGGKKIESNVFVFASSVLPAFRVVARVHSSASRARTCQRSLTPSTIVPGSRMLAS
jgi:hypothetical protein